MEEEIIAKLREFLSKHTPITEECCIVYLMVEIRKLIERMSDESKKQYSILRFYCNWLVHPCKDRDNRAIVDIMEKIYTSINKEFTFPEQRIFIPGDDSAYEFINLIELYKEMKAFFNEFSLGEELFKNENWVLFRDSLIKVLINQPIIEPIDNIKLVCFKPAMENAAHLIIEFNDGREPRRFLWYMPPFDSSSAIT